MFGKAERKSKIVAILNKYKDTLDEFNNSSDKKSLDQQESSDQPGLIDKGTCNARRLKGFSLCLLEKDCLDKNILITSFRLAPKTQNFQVYKRHDVACFSPMNGRTQYREGQKEEEDKKDKRSRENGSSERGRGDHCGNKINPVVRKSRYFEANIYYHIIYRCY